MVPAVMETFKPAYRKMQVLEQKPFEYFSSDLPLAYHEQILEQSSKTCAMLNNLGWEGLLSTIPDSLGSVFGS